MRKEKSETEKSPKRKQKPNSIFLWLFCFLTRSALSKNIFFFLLLFILSAFDSIVFIRIEKKKKKKKEKKKTQINEKSKPEKSSHWISMMTNTFNTLECAGISVCFLSFKYLRKKLKRKYLLFSSFSILKNWRDWCFTKEDKEISLYLTYWIYKPNHLAD